MGKRKFENSEEMRSLAESYFKQYPHPDDFTETDEKREAVNTIREGLIPTLNGLAIKLGFSSINALYEYNKKEGFKQVMDWIRAKIGSYWELNLNSKFANGAQKWLESVQPDNWGDKTRLKDAPPVALVVLVGNKTKGNQEIEAQFTEVKQIEAQPIEQPKRGRPKGSLNKKTKRKKINKNK